MQNRKAMCVFLLCLLSGCAQKLQLNDNEKKNVDTLLHKGRQYYINKDYSLAMQTFEYILEHYGEDLYSASWSQYEIATIHYRYKDYDKTKQALEKILVSYPLPEQPRILATKLLKKINSQQAHKRSTYTE